LQTITFNDVVESIKDISTNEKQEIQQLLNQYIREERHDQIDHNFKLAQVDHQKGEVKFSDHISELRQLIEESWKLVLVPLSNAPKKIFETVAKNC
jgi:hypothetical protein